MFSKILVHLVVVGQNPSNNEYSIGLSKEKDNYFTLNIDCNGEDPAVLACSLADYFIKAPPDWYSIRKQSFIAHGDKLRLIYTVTIPNNIKLKNADWLSVGQISQSNISEDDRDVIIEGLKL